jgi:hypothetical protein
MPGAFIKKKLPAKKTAAASREEKTARAPDIFFHRMAQIFYFPRLRHGGRRPRPASPSRPIQSTSCSRRPAFVRALRAGLGISCRSLVDWIRLSKRLSQVVFFLESVDETVPMVYEFQHVWSISGVILGTEVLYSLRSTIICCFG